MKKLFTLLCTLLICDVLLAQIPNPSFENWAGGFPDGWKVASFYITGNITQSTTAHAGSYAVQLNSAYAAPKYYGVIIHSGNSAGYFVNSGNPVAVNGWYMLNVSNGDELVIGAATKCSSSINGGGNLTLTNSTAVYKQFSVCLGYSNSCTADSASITMGLINTGGYTHSGSYAIIDDISFGPCTINSGIDELNNGVKLESAYPNPASSTCNIVYSLPAEATVNIALYDISGRKVEALLNDTRLSPGRYKLPVDVSNLINGLYIYMITVDGQPYVQRFTVAK